MKLHAVAISVLALCAGSMSFAAQVTASKNLDFLAVDGQKASKTLLKQTKSLNLSNTDTHQVVVRLGDIVGNSSDQTLFESNPIIVTFQGSSEDLEIIAPSIRSNSAGEKFNANPEIMVKTKSGQTIPAKVDVLKQEGLFPGANVISDLAEYNASGATASVAAFATSASAPAAPMVAMAPAAGNSKAAKGKVVVQGQNVAEQQLQYWFQQADKETQTRFLNWAKSQK